MHQTDIDADELCRALGGGLVVTIRGAPIAAIFEDEYERAELAGYTVGTNAPYLRVPYLEAYARGIATGDAVSILDVEHAEARDYVVRELEPEALGMPARMMGLRLSEA